jgi:integrase
MRHSDHAFVRLSTESHNRAGSFHETYSIFDGSGRRKYLTRTERAAFLRAAQNAPAKVRALCTVLAYTGCRLSEALKTTPERIDVDAGVIVFETLKRRRSGVFRSIPIPQNLAMQLRSIRGLAPGSRLWPWSRTTAWRRIKGVLGAAGVVGPHASPKGLRHAFGVLALQDGVPLTSVSRWLGHARLSTTAIYANAVGEEDRAFARKFWNGF